jgi:hypothetical protein
MPDAERKVVGMEGWKVKVPEDGRGEFETEFTHDISVHPQEREEVRDLLWHLNKVYAYKEDYTLASNHRWSPEKNALLVRNLQGRDVRLLCIEVDSKFLDALAIFYSPQETPEHRLIDRCIQDLYENGKLSERTVKHLRLLQGALRFCDFSVEVSGELDEKTILWLNTFVASDGVAVRLFLNSPEDVKLVQERVGAPQTGRYDLDTIVKVAQYQESLKNKEFYEGKINGLWDRATKLADDKRQESLGVPTIEEFGGRPDQNLLLPEVIELLKDGGTRVFVGEEWDRYVAGGGDREEFIWAGMTVAEGDAAPRKVWIEKGSRLWREVERDVWLENVFKDIERGQETNLEKVADELERRGLTPEFVEKMDTLLEIEMIFLPTAGGIGRISKPAAKKFAKEVAKKSVKEGVRRKVISKAESIVWKGLQPFRGGIKRFWKGKRVFYCTWDATHGHIEVFNRVGEHVGIMDTMTGIIDYSKKVPGRILKGLK